jgi:hypothetical protein
MTDPGTNASRMHWLRGIGRMLLLRPPGDPLVAVDSRWLGLTAVAALATWILVDWLREQPAPHFYAYYLPDIAWYALLILGLARVLARWSTPALEFSGTLLLVLAAAPATIVALYLIQIRLESVWAGVAVTTALCLYLIMYFSKGLRALSGRRQWRALVLGAVFAAAGLWVTNALYVDPSVWYSESDEENIAPLPADEAEPLLFAQSQRIDERVARLAPSDPVAPGAFFVGFAGYGEQRVFAEEIKLAENVVGKRFGSTDRSLLLINDRRSLDDAPLASPTALRYALQAVAKKMNLDKDVLFLALSSHGSSDGSLSVSNSGLALRDLTAGDLASFLKEAGIKWRVVVVSACYSGTFVEPMLSSATAVITSSSADRTSFGCADDRDLTYFGEAFYRDALRNSASLRKAFDAARSAIAAREKSEGITASHPQPFFGYDIERKLATLPVSQPAPDQLP